MAPATPNPPPETGKRRASRISLTYFKTPNGLEKAKVLLMVFAVFVAAGWLAWGTFIRPAQGRMSYSRGPVASVHAAWDNQCSACHTDFSPMSEGNPFMKHPAVSDGKCQDCHQGTIHHGNMKAESVVSCGGCHREHQGRNFSLVQLSDSDCTSCHRDLKNHMDGEAKSTKAMTITSFAADHPPFLGGKPVDPGRLKFNHKLHLMPGQAAPDSVGGFTLGKIKKTDPAAYERFKTAAVQDDKADMAFVKLDCASCHVLDAGDQGLTNRARSSGLYMQPVNYDVHCKACHPLTFDEKIKGPDNRPLALPHHVQPADVDRLLWGAYAEFWTADKPALKNWVNERPTSSRPLPGKPPAGVAETAQMIEKDFKDAMLNLTKTKADGAKTYLLSGKTSCTECHYLKSPEAGGSFTVEPVNVPEQWFEHARFSHVSHRAMKCQDCHTGATESIKAEDVLIPDIANCKQCHGPQKHAGDTQLGGVRSDCTTCHSYHNGEEARMGIGARRRDPKQPLDLQEFLQGKRAK